MTFTPTAVHENAKIKDYSTINPDIDLRSIQQLLTEAAAEETVAQLIGSVFKGVKEELK